MGRRVALLIATYEYEDAALRRLTAPAHDVAALSHVLADRAIGAFDVVTLINKPLHRVAEAIGEFYRDRRSDDLTLLYFTGHGLRDDYGDLYLAMRDTRGDNLLFTGLPAERISRAMDSCPSRQMVLVLDCCYSGAFSSGRSAKAGTAVHTLEKFQGRGRTVLTATDATSLAFERDQMRSVFTHHLVAGLHDGSADLDGDGDITLDELYRYVYDHVIAEEPRQRPKKHDDIEGRTVIARNVNWTLPAHLTYSIKSPIDTDRFAAVDGLAYLLRVGNDTVRHHVREELKRLSQDHNQRVSAAATGVLESARHQPSRVARPITSSTTSATGQRGHNYRGGRLRSRLVPRTLRAKFLILMVSAVVAVSATFLVKEMTSEGASTIHSPELFDVSSIRVRGSVQDIAIDADNHLLFTGNLDGDSQIFDTNTRSMIGTIPIDGGVGSLILDPRSKRLYGENFNNRLVNVIDVDKREVVTTLPVPDGPNGLAFNAIANLLYVPTVNGDRDVLVFNLDTLTNVGAIRNPDYSIVYDVTTDAGGSTSHHLAFVALSDKETGSVLIADATPQVVQTIQVDHPVRALLFDHSTDSEGSLGTLYIATGDGLVLVIDLDTRTVTATVSVGRQPSGMAVDAGTDTLYVTNYDDKTVSAIDLKSHVVVSTIRVGTHPANLVVDPNNHLVYCANVDDTSISVIKRKR